MPIERHSKVPVRLTKVVCDKLDYDASVNGANANTIFSNTGTSYGTCTTYANAFKYLCSRANIPCLVIGGEDHAWKQVNDFADERLRALAASVGSGDPEVTQMLLALGERLRGLKGKKQYGYLGPALKAQVDDIVRHLAADPQIDEMYSHWCQLTADVKRVYTSKVDAPLPLEHEKTFKTIKNAVIRQAMAAAQMEQMLDVMADMPEPGPDDATAHEDSLEAGSISKGKGDGSKTLQMTGRPLISADELKALPKGRFVVTKTGCYPMIATLRLFTQWGITFAEEWHMPQSEPRPVAYTDRLALDQAITEKYHGAAFNPDFDGDPMPKQRRMPK